MGNCINLQTAVTWADDDEGWESDEEPESPPRGQGEKKIMEKERRRDQTAEEEMRGLYGEKGGLGSTEVKITITKKQLEELLRQVDGQKLPIHEVLMDVVSIKEIGDLQDRVRHWRPALQSIPEVCEQT